MKRYYAIVHKETGKLLLLNAQLPIYWNKKVAQRVAENHPDYVIEPLDIKSFEKFILTAPY